MAETASKKTLVWIIGGVGAALIAGMLILKVWFASTVFFPADEVAATAPAETVAAQDEPLDPRERIARDMVTPATPGTPVMPDSEVQLNPSDYSEELSRFIPIEVGMSRYAAMDELLLYYNDPESAAKVSSNERMIDGATLYVIRRSGLADDSIAAEETFALFDQDVLAAFGTRIQCRRGDNPNQWTTELCP